MMSLVRVPCLSTSYQIGTTTHIERIATKTRPGEFVGVTITSQIVNRNITEATQASRYSTATAMERDRPDVDAGCDAV